jgi:hypothetical protein
VVIVPKNNRTKKYVTRICEECGKEFTFAFDKSTQNRKFCSLSCGSKKSWRDKPRDMSGENNPMFGKKRPDTTERNTINNPMSVEEYRTKARLNQPDRNGVNNPMYGKSRPDVSESRRGIPLSLETRLKLSEVNKGKHVGTRNHMYGKPSPIGSGNSKGGIRKDLGIYVRSSWEANYARVLNYTGTEWVYEPKRFIFEGEGFSYMPDFYLPSTNEYIEVKGYMDLRALRNKQAMDKYYPDIKISYITRGEYNNLKLLYRNLVDCWEE